MLLRRGRKENPEDLLCEQISIVTLPLNGAWIIDPGLCSTAWNTGIHIYSPTYVSSFKRSRVSFEINFDINNGEPTDQASHRPIVYAFEALSKPNLAIIIMHLLVLYLSARARWLEGMAHLKHPKSIHLHTYNHELISCTDPLTSPSPPAPSQS